MINTNKSSIIGKIIENYQNKEKLYLERAIRHDYFAGHDLVTNKGTKQ
tara:strand:- start:235 stop:378 length:144 start_codon:yes stop_codon:yes gene_type:complete